MAAGGPPRIAVIALEGVAADTVQWRQDGVHRVTVVAKASFALVPDGVMTPVEPQAIVRAEVQQRHNVGGSVQLTPDLAPFLPRADIVLTGHACAPGGRPTTALVARLTVTGDAPLLDKAVHVRADLAGGEPVPFERMPLVYERAYGGIGFAENPLGRGSGPGKRPNLFDPNAPDRTVCFAPLSRALLMRKRLLGATRREALDGPVAEVPADFDWSYFNAAPADQRTDYLRGSETIALEGLHPAHARLQSRLPRAHAIARVHGLGRADAVHEIALTADTLRIDADALVCTLTWRGSFPVPDDQNWEELRVVAGVGTQARPIAWPSELAELDAVELADDDIEEDETAADQKDTALMGTVLIESSREPAKNPLPFQASPPAPAQKKQRVHEGPRALPFDPKTQQAHPLPAAEFVPVAGTALLDDHLAPSTPPPFRPVATPSRPPVPPPPPQPEPTPRKERPAELELVNETGLAFGTMPWRSSPPRDCIAIIAKASCDIVPGGPAELRRDGATLADERPAQGAGLYPSDFAPYKVRADVVVVGHARAPAQAVTSMEVGLRFGHRDNAFERRILVFGDRRWSSARGLAKASAPEPFLLMPLGWERAFGGPGCPLNPAGIGRADAMRRARHEPVPLPNLEDPDQRLRTPAQTPPPASFSARPQAWRQASDAAEAWPFFPEAFDWTRFQVAPVAQQLAFLQGDEPFALAGCLPKEEPLEGALPGVRVRCFALRGRRLAEIAMRLDTVVIDADARRLDLLWRGALGVADERAPDVDALHLLTEPIGEAPLAFAEVRAKLLRH